MLNGQETYCLLANTLDATYLDAEPVYEEGIDPEEAETAATLERQSRDQVESLKKDQVRASHFRLSFFPIIVCTSYVIFHV
jgi:hypothetical protein